jgi:hypothetical protein
MLGRQMHSADLLVPESSSFEAEIAIENFEKYKLSFIDQILA